MNKHRPTLCIVAGPNGSGKTTTTLKLLANEWAADSLYINPDNIAQDTFGDWNSPEAVLKAAKLATQQRYDCLEQGFGRRYIASIALSYERRPPLQAIHGGSPYLGSNLVVVA